MRVLFKIFVETRNALQAITSSDLQIPRGVNGNSKVMAGSAIKTKQRYFHHHIKEAFIQTSRKSPLRSIVVSNHRIKEQKGTLTDRGEHLVVMRLH